jgi:adenine-specific DNA methylase
MRDKLIAIEYFCSICGKRLYKSPDNEDVMLLDNLAHTYKTMKNELVIPRQKIPRGSSSARWIAHDFRFYRQVFSPRQVIAFNHLIRAIDDIPEQEYRNAFITIFSNSLEYNNMMVPYNYPHRKLHHLFTYHALPLTTMPVENNVWGVSNKGAGTFTNCFHRYRKAKEYAKRPYEKFKETKGKIRTVYPYGEKIDAKFVSSFEELKVNNNSALLYCSDSSNLPIPDKSIDAVITDPPYFDNIHYSELSNFFYVWLSLFKLGQWFERDYVPFENEATVNNGMNKTEQNYLECMTSVFTECKRVLKDSGILIFTFHHANPKAWWIILQVLRKSGFFVVDYFPVRSEYKVNPHIRGKAAVDTDLVIICNNHPDSVENSAVNFEKALKRKISDVTGENSVHFYFIGELLKIYSHQQSKISFEDFISVFEKISDLSTRYGIKYSKKKREKDFIQLKL